MFGFREWEFCQRFDCRDPEPVAGIGDRFFARQWLQRFQHDVLKIAAMRALLSQQGVASDLSRMSDTEVVNQIAGLLTSGRVHVHVQRSHATAAGVPRSGSAGPAATPEPPAPAPRPEPEPGPRGPIAAYRPIEAPDGPTFPSDTDLAAQAATLVAAAHAGAPFCPI